MILAAYVFVALLDDCSRGQLVLATAGLGTAVAVLDTDYDRYAMDSWDRYDTGHGLMVGADVSLGVAVAFRMQVWNIGAEGQFALGAIGATWAALTFPDQLWYILLPLMAFMGFLFFKVPSGLCIYFIASSLWGISERKLIPPPTAENTPPPTPKPDPPKKPQGGGGGAKKKKRKR